eukprot:CAMPEP_0167777708 /NCGR_PEP_ID=MMETSP0111_2-20121227/3853_1 /TAXON_ID=91324 /ORGANISM="Lotharella globosa, Strain CCCM811" /LENGTH=432 /DNA_ID=CAMNT_0007667941 /DNA_START=75 /DNA_END=1373 /DNA_ORIENTATION=+
MTEESNTNASSKWIPDESASACMRCDAEFTFFFRRHHCRKCGYVVCSNCSGGRMKVEGYANDQRVCTSCASGLRRKSDTLSSKKFIRPESPNRRKSAPEAQPIELERATAQVIGDISSMELFDSMASPSILIIDIREAQAFAKSSLPRSMSVPLLPEVQAAYKAWADAQNSEENNPETTDESASEDTPTPTPTLPTLAMLEKKLSMRTRMALKRRRMSDVIVVSDDGNRGPLSPAMVFAKLATNTRSVRILSGGFNGLVKKYPFVPGEKPIPWYPTIVLDGFLYLGCEADARLEKHLDNLGITHILNVSAEVKNLYPEKYTYMHVDILDEKSSRLDEHFEKTIEFLNTVRESNEKKRAMVHCYQGVSRSSSIVLAYLMKSQKWTLKRAHTYLKKLRPMINPNPGFWQQLGEFEKKLFGGASTLAECIDFAIS